MKTYITILMGIIVLFWIGSILANPIGIIKSGDSVYIVGSDYKSDNHSLSLSAPEYLKIGFAVILLIEAIGVITVLSLNKVRFWPCFAVFVFINYLLFLVFSKWLFLLDGTHFNVNMNVLFAELFIIMIEAMVIYFFLRHPLFRKTSITRIRAWSYAVTFSISANVVSAIIGLMYSFCIYKEFFPNT